MSTRSTHTTRHILSGTGPLLLLLMGTLLLLVGCGSESGGGSDLDAFDGSSDGARDGTSDGTIGGLDPFYTQSMDCIGLTIAGSDNVDPRSLQRVCDSVTEILTPMSDVLAQLQQQDVLIAVYGMGERPLTTPEAREYLGSVTDNTCGGSNGAATNPGLPPYMQVSESFVHCLVGPLVSSAGGDVILHELAHIIHSHALYPNDRAQFDRIAQIYDNAIAAGRWTDVYAGSNEFEFFARSVERYFNATPEHWGNASRADLVAYEPEIAALIESLFGARTLQQSCSARVVDYSSDQAPWARADGSYDATHPTAMMGNFPPDDPLRMFCERIADCSTCDDTRGIDGCLSDYNNIRVFAPAYDVPDPTLQFGSCAMAATCFEAVACANQLLYGDYPWVAW